MNTLDEMATVMTLPRLIIMLRSLMVDYDSRILLERK